MPKRIALAAIGVTRNGQTVYPPIGNANEGEPFEFTSEEISQIEALEKANDVVMLRKLRNEGTDDAKPASTPAAKPAAAPAATATAGVGNTDLTKLEGGAGDNTAPVAKTFTVKNSADELKTEATARGLDFSTLKTKAELVALLDANPAAPAEKPAEEDEDL